MPIHPTGPHQGAGDTAISGTPRFCPECGSALEPGAVFCGECGARIEPVTAGPPKKPPKKQPRATPTPKPPKASAPKPRPAKPKARSPRRAPPPPRAAPVAGAPRTSEADATEDPAGLTFLGVAGALIGNVLLLALAWGLGWGAGGLLVFYELADPAAAIDFIATYGFDPEAVDFAANGVAAGILGGAAAGLLMVLPYAGVFAAGPGRFLIALIGWFLVMVLSRYAAIAFNFYLAEHIVAYFALCGFALGAVSAATLAGRKPGGHVVRVLSTGLIWAAAAALARFAMIAALGM